MLKKILLTLSILMVFTVSTYAGIPYEDRPDTSGISFKDVPAKHWAKSTIYRLAAQKTQIFVGYPDGTFKPERYVSRAEFVTALIRTLGYEPSREADFPDVSADHWASKYIGTAQEKGIIEKGDYGSFMPEGEITRLEACRMMINSFPKAKEAVKDEKFIITKHFADMEDMHISIKRMASLLSETAVLTGYPDRTARLGKNSTRAEIASFIMRFMARSGDLEAYEIPKEDVRNGIKYIGLKELNKKPAKMVKMIGIDDDGEGNAPLDVQVTINKLTMFKYDSSYKGEYKDILYKGSQRFLEDYIKNKTTNIIAVEATTVNNSGYTTAESGMYFEVKFQEDIKVKNISDNYVIKRSLEHKDGTAYWLKPDKGKNAYSYTAFIIVDKLPKTSIELSKQFLGYCDEVNKKPAFHRSNAQYLGIDLTK